MARARLVVTVEYDAADTDPDGIAALFDVLMETALSTGVARLERSFGKIEIGDFTVLEEGSDHA